MTTQLRQPGEPVVVLHGLWMSGPGTTLLRQQLQDQGYRAESFSYRSVADDLASNADRLAELVHSLQGKCHLVGHSLGGVVVSAMLRRHGTAGVGRVVCVGSPLAGSRAAAGVARFPGGEMLLGHSADALRTAHDFQDQDGCEVGMIAGDSPIGIGGLVTGLEEPHDGAVMVSETKVAGLKDHIVLPVNHLAMLWSAEVVAQIIAFLQTGRFAR